MKKVLFLLLLVCNVSIAQTLNVADMLTGGTLTLGAYFRFNVNQTTAGQTITVPSFIGGGKDPIIVNNIGTAPFTLSPGGVIPTGNALYLDWNGSAWIIIGKGFLGSYNLLLTQTISNGDTAHASSSDAVFDALALKAPVNAQCSIASTVIDWNCTHSYKTLSATTTFTFSNVADAKTIIVKITNTSGNSYTITWPTVDWGASGPPIQRAGISGTVEDIYTFIRINGIIYGAVRQ